MNLGRTVLAQLMDYLDPDSFERIVERHNNGRRQYRCYFRPKVAQISGENCPPG